MLNNPTTPKGTDLEALAGRLTEAQRKALTHPKAGGTSYAWASRGTLDALHSRKLLGRIVGPGSMWSPQTAIQWPLTPRGLALRDYLRARSATPEPHPGDNREQSE